MINSLFQRIKSLIDGGASPGCSVALYANGKTEAFAYGTFSGPGSQAVSPETIYDIASVTKLFTTALVITAHENGLLSIFDRCGLYLENFRNSALTVLDLLTHRAAFQISLGEISRKYHSKNTLQQALKHMTPPAHASDSIEYHNGGPYFAGLILERVLGIPLQQQMTEFFGAFGLAHTFTGIDVRREKYDTPPTEAVNGLVISGVTHDESARVLGGLAGHAGVFSTSLDLCLFGRAWLDRRIITTDQLWKEITRDHDLSGSSPQAVGWWLRYKNRDGTVIKTPGIYSHVGYTGPLLAICPANGKVAALTCNRTYYGRDNSRHRQIWALLIDWLYQN